MSASLAVERRFRHRVGRPASRLNTVLVEAGDFASATSSRSTKLIHGGIRYLQEAVTDSIPGSTTW